MPLRGLTGNDVDLHLLVPVVFMTNGAAAERLRSLTRGSSHKRSMDRCAETAPLGSSDVPLDQEHGGMQLNITPESRLTSP